MNLKFLYSFFLFFITVVLTAQNTNGRVVYSVSLDPFFSLMAKKFENEPNHKGLKLFQQATKIASSFECQLLFNNHLSKFELKNNMVLDKDERLQFIAERMVVKGEYYTNLIKSFQVLKDNSGKELYIKSSIDTDWTLSKETKNIGNYVCYKATSYKQLPSSKALVTVWYTPQIPVAFGPKQFVGNLPGLILEFEDNAVHFIAKKIMLNPKKTIEISWPGAETISKEEHERQTGNSFQQLKESYGRD